MRILFVLLVCLPHVVTAGTRVAYRITDRETGTTFLYLPDEPRGFYEEMVAWSAPTLEQVRRQARQWRFENFRLCRRVSPTRFMTVGPRTFGVTFFTRRSTTSPR